MGKGRVEGGRGGQRRERRRGGKAGPGACLSGVRDGVDHHIGDVREDGGPAGLGERAWTGRRREGGAKEGEGGGRINVLIASAMRSTKTDMMRL